MSSLHVEPEMQKTNYHYVHFQDILIRSRMPLLGGISGTMRSHSTDNISPGGRVTQLVVCWYKHQATQTALVPM